MTLCVIKRDELVQYFAQMLNISQYKDYCPNGLQVEGCSEISLIVSGVTANLAMIKAAFNLKADAILVHHGCFWYKEDMPIVGFKKQRLKMLLTNDINLFAYHLPLDDHIEFGNNAQFAYQLGLVSDGRFGEKNFGWLGKFNKTSMKINTVGDLVQLIKSRFNRTPFLIGNAKQEIDKVAWCTGAAQEFFVAAIETGVKVFISGEISESSVHLARESGVAYIAAGHHATERYGVQALGQHIADKFNIRHQFIEIDNPI